MKKNAFLRSGDRSIRGPLTKLFGFGLSVKEKKISRDGLTVLPFLRLGFICAEKINFNQNLPEGE